MTKLSALPASVSRLQQIKPLPPKPTIMSIPDRREPAVSDHQQLSFDQFVKRYPLTPRTAALGYCDDGLPMLFDLTDPRTGPVLVLGDSDAGKSNLVKVLVQSAVHFNTPKDFQYLLSLPDPKIMRN
jgi:DNA segregation ATPase FtsK/SpoIIIE-like protein